MISNISPWVARLVLMIMAPIGAAAIWLTRKYASASIETLPEQERMVRQLSIDVLLAAHIALVIVIALLPAKQFRALRLALAILSLSIWAFDGVGMFGARYGIMDRAETTLAAAAQRVSDQRAVIKGLQDSAAALRATASRQMANTMITASAQSQREAARLEAKAAALAEQLATMPDGSGTSEIRVYGGAENAVLRAIVEAALVSLVLVAACVLVGLMLREVLLEIAARRPAAKPAPAKPAVKPTQDPPPSPMLRRRLEAGRAMLEPATPAPDKVRAPAGNAPALAADAPETDALALTQVQDEPQRVQTQAVEGESKSVPDGVREAIRSGAINPTQGGIKSLGHGQTLAEAWLKELGAEGVLEPAGRGRWKLKA